MGQQFVGSVLHALDAKGRVVLPAEHRAAFADAGYLVPTGECLALYTEEGFTELMERLEQRVRSSGGEGGVGQAQAERARRRLAASAHRVRADGQGRVVVPPELREQIGVEGTVRINGAGNRIELWNDDHWDREAGVEGLASALTGLL